jgi:A/G-specific adenine glycosylase
MSIGRKKFCTGVWNYYEQNGRHSLPWRHTKNPYHILVSEIMLQQTQVDRVLPKYVYFLKCFPTIKRLAEASLGDVLRVWQGLGYNRRAQMLHQCARALVKQTKNGRTPQIPKTKEELMQLPGIGPYTAGAILAFAYQIPTPFIETNIRTVYIHHFFPHLFDITDKEILVKINETLNEENPREWYYALMDYGAYLKQTAGNKNVQSRHYTRQSSFKDSDRYIRGRVIALLSKKTYTRAMFHTVLRYDPVRIDALLSRLLTESLISYKRGVYQLPT